MGFAMLNPSYGYGYGYSTTTTTMTGRKNLL